MEQRLSSSSPENIYFHYSKGIDLYKNKEFQDCRSFLLFAARGGVRDAMYHLGLLYRMDVKGVEYSLRKGRKWILRAAKKGHLESQSLLGSYDSEGKSLFDLTGEQMRRYMLKAAYKQCARSQFRYARICEEKSRGFWLAEAVKNAQQLDSTTLYDLHLYYEQGLFVERDEELSRSLLSLAAEKGGVDARYAQALVDLEADQERGIEALQTLVEEGVVDAEIALGVAYARSDETEKAFKIFKRRAKEGVPGALYNLALLYEMENDLALAFMSMEQAAKEKFSLAVEAVKEFRRKGYEKEVQQFNKRTNFEKGIFLEAKGQIEEALKLYTLAANVGHLQARRKMVEISRKKLEEENSPEQSVIYRKQIHKWLILLSENGCHFSTHELGASILESKVEGFKKRKKNVKKALSYFSKIPDNQFERSAKILMEKGDLYLESAENRSLAFLLYAKVAEKKQVEAVVKLAQIYEKENQKLAASYWKQARELGYQLEIPDLDPKPIEKEKKNREQKGHSEIRAIKASLSLIGSLKKDPEIFNSDRKDKDIESLQKSIDNALSSSEKGTPSHQFFLGHLFRRKRFIEKEDDKIREAQVEAIRYFEPLAQGGNKDAKIEIALLKIYWLPGSLKGSEKKKKQESAIQTLFQLGKENNISAKIALGHCYLDGNGVQKDLDQAISCYQSALELIKVDNEKFNNQEKASIYLSLGRSYLENSVVQDRDKEAFDCFLQAAKLGNLAALFEIGDCFQKGRGVKKNEGVALKFYQFAADNGEVESAYRATLILKKEERYDEALKFCRMAADQGDHLLAKMIMGTIYHIRNDFEKAIEYLKPAADQGSAEAQYELGSIYLKKKSPKEMLSYYKKSAEKNFPLANHALAQIYVSGFEDIEKDVDAAIRYYRKASQGGVVGAQLDLGRIYFKKGVIKESKKYYHLAADHKQELVNSSEEKMVAEAQLELATIYHAAEFDIKKAKEYYIKSIKSGYRLGTAHFELANISLAEKSFQTALDNYYLAFCSLNGVNEEQRMESAYQIGRIYQTQWDEIKSKARGSISESVKSWYGIAIEGGHKNAVVALDLFLKENKGKVVD